MKSARKRVPVRRAVRRPAPLTLSARVERLEKTLLFPAPAKAASPRLAPRFINLGADGKPAAADHVAIYQPATDLIWTAAPMQSGKEFTHAEAIGAAASLDLMGAKDWRLPTIQELLSIVDYDRCDPAVDPKHFKGPYSWAWSSTVAKAPAGYAWVVYLSFGGSGRGGQDNHDHALAVRAGQQLGLRL